MISIKNAQEIKIMREGGKRLAEIMRQLALEVLPGKSTLELDKLAERLVFDNEGVPSFKGYGKESGNPFPATICVSLNSEVVHGVPKKNVVLKNGDLVKIDIGMEYKKMHVDMARTFAVGAVSEKAQKLSEVTKKSLDVGIKKIKAGNKLSEYSKAVQEYVEKNGFSAIRSLVGHGIGKFLHEDPQIPNFFNKRNVDMKIKSGMTLALEPMINEDSFEIMLSDDGWTYCTKDGKLSAHFEDTVLVTANGAEILTRA